MQSSPATALCNKTWFTFSVTMGFVRQWHSCCPEQLIEGVETSRWCSISVVVWYYIVIQTNSVIYSLHTILHSQLCSLSIKLFSGCSTALSATEKQLNLFYSHVNNVNVVELLQVSKKNLMEIVKKLMLHVDKAEGTTYRDELLTKIIDICSQSNYQYITNFEW